MLWIPRSESISTDTSTAENDNNGKHQEPSRKAKTKKKAETMMMMRSTTLHPQPSSSFYSPSPSLSWLLVFNMVMLLGQSIRVHGQQQQQQQQQQKQQVSQQQPPDVPFLFHMTHAWLVPLYTILVLIYVGIRLFRLFRIQQQQQVQLKTTHRAAKPKDAAALVTHHLRKSPSSVADAPSATKVLEPTKDDEEEDKALIQQQQPINLTGVFRLISNTNFEEFLAAQGVSWALRRAANQARPIHRITHKGDSLTIKIEGIIESQTTYILHGPPVETNVRGRLFLDQAKYTEDGTGIRVSKTAITENYDVTVTRRLSDDGQQIVLTSCAMFRDDQRPPVQAVQIFQRVE